MAGQLYYRGDLTQSVHAQREAQREIHMNAKTRCIFDLLIKYGMMLDATNLEWVLQQGTLLSAIRHAGYNPYDYDADIGVYYDTDADYRTIEAAVGKKHPKGLHYSFTKLCGRTGSWFHVDIVGLVRNQEYHNLIDSLTTQDVFHNIPIVDQEHQVYTRKHSRERYTIPRTWVFPRLRCTIHGLVFPCYYQSVAVLHSFYGNAMIDVIRSRKKGVKCHKDDEASHDACYATHTLDEASVHNVRKAYHEGFSTLLDLPSLALCTLYPRAPPGAKAFGPLVFMHLRKSGGSTMRGLFWDHQEEGHYEVQNEVEKWTQLPDGERKLIKISHEAVDKFTITQPCYRCFFGITRDPLERILSLYNYRICMEQIPKQLGFMRWFRTTWRKDFLTHQLAGRAFGRSTTNESEILRQAKKNVEQRFFAFGILEHWDDSLRLFRLLRPDYFPSLMYRSINVHKDKSVRVNWESLRKEDQRTLRELLRWDIELHGWLVERFSHQVDQLKTVGLWKGDRVTAVEYLPSGSANRVPHYLLNVGKLSKCDSSYDSSHRATVAKPNFHPKGVSREKAKQPTDVKQRIFTDETVAPFLRSW